MSTSTQFRTPARILIPKLLKSRDKWKAKATQRKAQNKALQIRARDLQTSRDLHRQHAEQLQRQVDDLQGQVDELQRQLVQLRQQATTLAPAVPEKKVTDHVEHTIPSASSTWL